MSLKFVYLFILLNLYSTGSDEGLPIVVRYRLLPKRQGSLGNVGIMGFVFTNFPTDNYGTSSGDDEGNCVYN